VSNPSEGQQKCCASCGEFRQSFPLSLYYPPKHPDKGYLLCAECLRSLEEGERLYAVFTPEYETPGPPEEGFGPLFKAARVLLKDGVTDEDQIISTLTFTHEVYRKPAKGAKKPSEGRGHLLPTVYCGVKVIDGVHIVEREPISAGILVQRRPPDNESRHIPRGILIQVFSHKKVVGPERVASVYKEELAAKGIPCESSRGASIKFEFVGNRLYLTIMPAQNASVDRIAFPPPRLVSAFYRGLMEEFSKRLTTRGREFEAYNLIPACVAFLLRVSGGIKSRKEVHRLLNDFVFCEKKLPEEGYASTSEVVQLWGDVHKAGERIARTLPFMRAHPLSEPFKLD
jgi:hypothetical protein